MFGEKKQGLNDIYDKYDSLRKQYGDNNECIEKELKLWYKGLPDGHAAKDHSHYSKVDEKGIFLQIIFLGQVEVALSTIYYIQ